MASKLTRFSNRDALESIGRAELLEFLEPHRAYLEGRQVVLPADVGGPLDLDRLSAVLMDPNEQTPAELSDALYYVTEMSTGDDLDALLDAAEAEQLELGLGPQPAPVDVAVRFWLKNPEGFKDVHNAAYLERVKSFISFGAEADPLPPFAVPDASGLVAMQTRLDEWFFTHKRGKRSRIFPYARNDGHWFLIRHGETMKREGTYNDGNEGNAFYRPMKHDVVIYDPEAGQLRIHCGSKKEMELYRKVFGLHLFGNEEFFGGSKLYSLKPILEAGPGCLSFTDLGGVEQILLTVVEFSWPGTKWHRETHKSNDIFALFESRKWRWPDLDRIAMATFSVFFSGHKKARTVTIQPANKLKFQRIDDAPVLKPWLEQFMDDEEEENEEPEGVVE